MTAVARPPEAQASIDVAFTPADVRSADVAVVVDVLRASSTIVAALSVGFERVLCVGDVEGARALAGPGRALAGERHCKPIEGFDYGNSPGALPSAAVPDLVLCTTNGTPAVLAAAEACGEVLIGALLNLDALVRAVPAGADVTIVCSGTDRRFALEDAYMAGLLAGRLRGSRTDAALAAAQLAGSYAGPRDPLGQSSDAAVLRATGQAEDIEFCARESVFEIVPRVTGSSGGVAVVNASGSATTSGDGAVAAGTS